MSVYSFTLGAYVKEGLDIKKLEEERQDSNIIDLIQIYKYIIQLLD